MEHVTFEVMQNDCMRALGIISLLPLVLACILLDAIQQTYRYLFSICGVFDMPQMGCVTEAASSGPRQAHGGLSIFVEVGNSLRQIVEQIINLPVPSVVEEIMTVPKVVTEGRFITMNVDQIFDVPIPQVMPMRQLQRQTLLNMCSVLISPMVSVGVLVFITWLVDLISLWDPMSTMLRLCIVGIVLRLLPIVLGMPFYVASVVPLAVQDLRKGADTFGRDLVIAVVLDMVIKLLTVALQRNGSPFSAGCQW
eukprot:6464931-Amphidinium_carterae.1